MSTPVAMLVGISVGLALHWLTRRAPVRRQIERVPATARQVLWSALVFGFSLSDYLTGHPYRASLLLFVGALDLQQYLDGRIIESWSRLCDAWNRECNRQLAIISEQRTLLARKDDEIDVLNARLLEANAELVILRGEDDLPPEAA